MPISGPLLEPKAEEFAYSIGKNDVKASTGCHDGFKERKYISFKTICWESGLVDIEAANSRKDNLLQMIEMRKTFLTLMSWGYFSNTPRQNTGGWSKHGWFRKTAFANHKKVSQPMLF